MEQTAQVQINDINEDIRFLRTRMLAMIDLLEKRQKEAVIQNG